MQKRIDGLNHQIDMLSDKRNTIIRVNRAAKTALDVFDDILAKEHLERNDLELIIDRIAVFEDHLEIKLKPDIDAILQSGFVGKAANFNSDTENISDMLVQSSKNHEDKVFCVNVISDGDPLEIYTDHDGEVVLKKYSPIGEIASVAKDYTDALLRTLGHVAIITDRDVVVSASGSPKKELWEKPISSEMESAMHNRQLLRLGDIEGMDPARAGMRLIPVTGEELTTHYISQIICPIIADGEVVGCVVLMGREGERMGDVETKVVETTASLVGRQMEQ